MKIDEAELTELNPDSVIHIDNLISLYALSWSYDRTPTNSPEAPANRAHATNGRKVSARSRGAWNLSS